jgi:APA family basic amino acid/polyamine antiporter
MSSKTQKIGLITATSLVIGNMIGVGIFLLPSTLAKYGSISLLGWVVTAAGSLVLAKIFSNFSKIIVSKSGGPYAYSREGFGDFTAFLVAWGYWMQTWISNGAIAIAIVGAMSYFFPVLETNSLYSITTGLALIWFFTWINTRGIKESGRVQVVTTVLKLLPLVFVILVGVFYIDLDNFPVFNLTGESDLSTLTVVSTLTFFSFLGIECATVPAANVENPKVNIPKATMVGTILTSIVYILGTIVLFGILPMDDLQNSPAPFAEAAKLIAGDFGGFFVSIGVIISGLGVLNGWILITGQVPMATAMDNLFPKFFMKENKKGAPALGLIVGSLLASFIMLMNFTKGLVDQFELIVEIAVFVALVPYLLTAASYILVVIERKLHTNSWVKTWVLGGLGFIFTIGAIYGSGSDTVFYGFFLLLSGIPFYILMKWNKREK